MIHEMGERHQQIIVSLLCEVVLSLQNVIIFKTGLIIQLSVQTKHAGNLCINQHKLHLLNDTNRYL